MEWVNGMDKNLINQLLALPGEELHLKKVIFSSTRGQGRTLLRSVKGRMSIKKFESSGHIFALRLVGPNNVIGEVPLYEGEHKNICVQRHRSGGLLCLFHSFMMC